jgi:ferredoxin
MRSQVRDDRGHRDAADAEVLSYDVVLVTSDGVESDIRVDSQTTVLAAAERAGSVLKSACRTGGCGACSAVTGSCCAAASPATTAG